MKAIIQPSNISGSIIAPASKSLMQRACAASLLKKGKTIIKNFGISNDDETALNIIQNLGAKVERIEQEIIIDSNGFTANKFIKNSTINCNESGLCLRMFTPIIALHNEEVTIDGRGSLLKRPINFITELLKQLNVNYQTKNDSLPLKINGGFTPKDIEVDASISSQLLTGLLFAYAAYFDNNLSFLINNSSVTIKVNSLKSKPYIDLTLQVIKDFGLPFPENKSYEYFIFSNKSIQQNKSTIINYSIEADWSSVSFLLVAGAIAGNILIKNIHQNSFQADRKIIEVLKSCGANILFENNNVIISKFTLQPFEFDATDCPDLFPPLVALAAYCNGASIIKGVHRLTYKESNRTNSLQEEFLKMGVTISVENDTMKIVGGNIVYGAEINTHQDHRIAMACAVAALQANGSTIIHHCEVVQKSYPNFFEHLKQLQANIYFE